MKRVINKYFELYQLGADKLEKYCLNILKILAFTVLCIMLFGEIKVLGQSLDENSYELKITAEAKHSLSSLGKDVRIKTITVDGNALDLSEIAVSNDGWKMQDFCLSILNPSSQNTLIISLNASDEVIIEFIKQEGSGYVKVEVEGEQKEIDLYSKDWTTYTYRYSFQPSFWLVEYWNEIVVMLILFVLVVLEIKLLWSASWIVKGEGCLVLLFMVLWTFYKVYNAAEGMETFFDKTIVFPVILLLAAQNTAFYFLQKCEGVNCKNKKTTGFVLVTGILLVIINVMTIDYQITNEYGWSTLPELLFGDFIVVDWMIVAVILSGKTKVKEAKYITGIISWIVTPLCMFCVMEIITGNILNITGEYIALNLLLYYLAYAVISFCTRKLKVSGGLYCVIMTVVGLAWFYVYTFRDKPLTLFDLMSSKTAITVAGSYSYTFPLRVGLGLQVFVCCMILQYCFQNIEFRKEKRIAALRYTIIGFCIIAAFWFIKTDKISDIGLEKLNMWDVYQNYKNEGCLYTFLLECQYINVTEPDGYSQQEVERIENEILDCDYSEVSDVIQPTNLIVIMNESFSDPRNIAEPNTQEELLPFISSMSENTEKGVLCVPVYGGNTADTEYEFLTGNTKQFLPVGSVAYQVYCHDPEYGIAETLKNQGYRTVALHPYGGTNWNRNVVYPEMGFDEFYSLENWGEEIEYLRWCPNDETAYRKIEHIYEEKEENEKLFTFLVTMQNHGGYTENLDGYESTVSLDYDEDYSDAEVYLSLINESDQAFENLIHYFDEIDEPTMIVMFGDHLPALSKFYQELLGKSSEQNTKEDNRLLYETPYIIWTNYEREGTDGETMSANFFGSYVLQSAGLELTLYNEFLLNLKETIPVIGKNEFCNADGEWNSLSEIPEQYETLLNDYAILQYNETSDRKNLVESLFTLDAAG